MRILRCFGFLSLLPALAPAQITPGNLIVSRVGDGAAALTSAATARFLDEYTPSGAFVQTIALPTTPNGTQRRLTDSGTATSNGFLTQSADGRYLLAAGYDADVGTTGVTGTTSAAVNRIVGRVGLDGAVDTTTALNDAYSANNFRGVASLDGTSFWISGTGSGTSPGVRFVAGLGASTSLQLSTSVTNIRCLDIVGGQLYCSSASGAFLGVCTVGTGLPTTSGQTIALLPGFAAVTGQSTYDFFFAGADTLYVADDRTTAAGGIQKWTLVAGSWVLQYTLQPATNVGCRGLTGRVDDGVATLWSVTTSNLLVGITDTGAASPFTTLVTAAANTALRDVQFVRTPARVTHGGVGCPTSFGVPTIGTNGAPVTGNLGFQLTSSSNPPLSIVLHAIDAAPSTAPLGFPIPGAPSCAVLYVNPLLLLAELVDPLGNALSPVPIPANASLGGFVLSAQAFPFDITLVGFALPIGSSDAIDITVGN